MAIDTGTRLGHYEILEPLGAGGMGEVYRARDSRLDREVAVKVLPKHLSKDPASLHRFEREARILAALSHPNILTIYDIGSEGGVSFVVTEFLLGETLHTCLRPGPISWEKTVEIGIAVANGLAAAHSKGVIHRDLKPDNIFITEHGIAKILDFGLARKEADLVEDDLSRALTIAQDTSPGTILGTIHYMSPEQVKGMPADIRSDIFSLGCVLYEMATGLRPFTSASAVETMASILRDRIPDPVLAGVRIPPQLDKVIRRCLEKNPEERPQSAEEVATELRRITRGFPLPRVPASTPTRKRGRRSKKLDSIAILPFENVSQDSESEYLCDGITENIINMLSQLPDLRVMARSTVFRYKGFAVDPVSVGQELGVRAVLSGRIQNLDERVLVQAELVDTEDGSQLWGEQHSTRLCDLFQVQGEMAEKISEKLRLKILVRQKKRLKRKFTQNAEASRLYLLGRYWWNSRTYHGFQKAIEYFEASLREDPNFALAYSGLSDTYSLLGGFGYLPSGEAYIRAKADALRAIEIDDSLSEAHCSLATALYRLDWDWAGADAEFQKAIQIQPSNVIAHHWYGVFLSMVGRFEEGFSELQIARELDPLAVLIHWTTGYTLFYARRYEEALQQLELTMEMDPKYARAHVDAGIVCLYLNRPEEAIQRIRKALSLTKKEPSAMLASLGHAYGFSGARKEALEILKTLEERAQTEHVSPFSLALVHIGLGDHDQALQLLEKGFEIRQDAMASLKVNPRLDPLREYPRFQDLLQKLRLF